MLKSVLPSLEPPSDYQMLISIVYKSGLYWIYHSRSLFKPSSEDRDPDYSHTEQAWLLIRFQNQQADVMNDLDKIQNRATKFKEEGQQVKVYKGDVIKFGRVRFLVRELVTQTKSTSGKDKGIFKKLRLSGALSKIHNMPASQSDLNATGVFKTTRSEIGDDFEFTARL